MGIIGILWLIGLVLKAFGLISLGWLIVIFWPIIPLLILIILGVTALGIGFKK